MIAMIWIGRRTLLAAVPAVMGLCFALGRHRDPSGAYEHKASELICPAFELSGPADTVGPGGGMGQMATVQVGKLAISFGNAEDEAMKRQMLGWALANEKRPIEERM